MMGLSALKSKKNKYKFVGKGVGLRGCEEQLFVPRPSVSISSCSYPRSLSSQHFLD